MKMIFDELLSNIIKYAYEDDKEHQIDIKVEIIEDRLAASIIDDGRPFNPLESEPPDVGLSLKDQKMGGLGIYLVLNVMDKINYERQGEKNIITFMNNIKTSKS